MGDDRDSIVQAQNCLFETMCAYTAAAGSGLPSDWRESDGMSSGIGSRDRDGAAGGVRQERQKTAARNNPPALAATDLSRAAALLAQAAW